MTTVVIKGARIAHLSRPPQQTPRTQNASRLAQWVITIASLTVGTPSLWGATHYVSHSGSNTIPYDSWQTATDSILLAINASGEGDTVRVAAGNFTCDSLHMKRRMHFLGAGMDSTRVQYAGTSRKLIILADSCVVEGFHLDGGVVDTGKSGDLTYHLFYGILGFEDTSAVVRHNRLSNVDQAIVLFFTDQVNPTKRVSITENIFSNFQGAVYLLGASSEIHRNTFYVNNESIGEPIHQIGMSAAITGNSFFRSVRSAGQLIDFIDVLSIDVTNNICISPPSAYFGGIWVNKTNPGFPTSGRIENNLCVGGERGIYALGGNIRIVNNIIIGTILDLTYDVAATTPGNVGFNLFWHNAPRASVDTADRIASGCVFACPMFTDSLGYFLQAFSPAMDAGDTLLLDPDGTRSDIGPRGGPLGEIYAYLDLPPSVPDNPQAEGSDSEIVIRWSGGCEADFDRFEIYRDSQSIINPQSGLLLASVSGDTQFVDRSALATEGPYYYRLRAIDSQGNASELSDEVFASRVGVSEHSPLPTAFSLHPNVPNPFNACTSVLFTISDLPKGAPVNTRLTVCDLLGRQVACLVDAVLLPGEYSVQWCGVDSDGTPVASGPYLLRLRVSGSMSSRKIMLLK